MLGKFRTQTGWTVWDETEVNQFSTRHFAGFNTGVFSSLMLHDFLIATFAMHPAIMVHR